MGAAGTASWAASPARHEAGTPNLLGAIALAAVCDALTPQRWKALVDQEHHLLGRLRAGLATIPGVRELRLFTPAHPRVRITSFTIDRLDSAQVAQQLADEHGIGVRVGLFCAHPLTRHLLDARNAVPSSAIRASLGAGTSAEHVHRLATAVRAIATP
ncbi:aminotransferase class V-fold PLP-dependent enzyme [Micromonospora tulbaghiae]|uniref:aminotransferase class V-fold PLP-dependent enzyme n=1 Tax=Micromonospora tulbaghiae TaxID=479978 RepID=UPI0033CDCE8C